MTEIERTSPSGPKSRYRADVTKAIGSPGAAAVTAFTCTVTGARITDIVVGCVSSGVTANLIVSSPWVSTTNEVTFYVINPTAAPIVGGTVALAFEIETSPVTVS